MNILSAFVVALSLSMDNFALTLACGCAERGGLKRAQVLLVGGLFALAHVVLFSAGWLGGREAGILFDRFDHWVAFLVLAFIGLKMVKESFSNKNEPSVCSLFKLRNALTMAVATSLDALFVGVALSITGAPFWLTLVLLAACVMVTSCTGFYLGGWLGKKFGAVMEGLGGAALTAVGIKVLLNGLGIW